MTYLKQDKLPRQASSADQGQSPPWVIMKDLLVAVGLPPLATISWLLPLRTWRPVARLLAPLYAPGRGVNSRAEMIERIESAYAPGQETSWLEAALDQVGEEEILSLLQFLRDYRPGGWVPNIELSGRPHIDAALEHGRGAVLWMGRFVHADLVPKMAFHRIGLPLAHLSHPRHGFSSSRVGMRLLNPVKRIIEDRYLDARVLLEPAGTAAAMADLKDRLGENAVVSILGSGSSRRPLSPRFLGGQVKLAPGAPRLAYESGAALLPVIPIHDKLDGFTVYVESPITVDRSLGRDEAIEIATQAYAEVLARYALKYPGQWLGWFKA